MHELPTHHPESGRDRALPGSAQRLRREHPAARGPSGRRPAPRASRLGAWRRGLLARCSILIGFVILTLGCPRWVLGVCRFEFARRRARRAPPGAPAPKPVWTPDPRIVRQIELQLAHATKPARRSGPAAPPG